MGASLIFDLLGRDVSASKAIKKVAAEAEHSSGTIGAAFKKAATGVSVAGLALVAESVHMAGNFQSQMTRLVTAAGESQNNIKMVSAGVLKVASDTGTSTDELAAGMYMVESAGFHGANGLKVLSAAAQGAKVEGADLGATGNALTTVMNDLHAPASAAADIMSQMVATVGQGKMTMDDLAGSIHSVLPNAAALHLSFAQVAGALAEMTAQGISADQAAQNLNHVIVKLAAPTASMTTEMASYGVNAADLAKNLGKNGLTGTMAILSEAILKRMGPAGVTLRSAFNQSQAAAKDTQREFNNLAPATQRLATEFLQGHIAAKTFSTETGHVSGMQGILAKQWLNSEKRAHGFSAALKAGGQDSQTYTAAMKGMVGDSVGLQVALHLTGGAAAGFNDKVKTISGTTADAGGGVKDFAVKQATLNVQIQKMVEAVKVAMIELGTKLIPVVTRVVEWVVKHKDALIKLVVAIVAFAVAVKVVNGVLAVARAIMLAWTVVCRIATIGMWLFNAAIAANPITLIVIAVVALIAVFVLAYNKIGWFRDFVKAAFHMIATVIGAVIDWVKAHWPLLLAILLGPFGLLVYGIVKYWSAIKNGIMAVIHWVGHNWPVILAVLTGPFGLLVLFIAKNWTTIKNAFLAVIKWISTTASNMWAPIGTALSWVYNHTIGPIINGIKGAIDTISGAIASLTGNHMESGLVKAFNAKAKAAGVKGFASGGDPDDGWFTAGEAGTELMHKSGSALRVFSHSQSTAMARTTGHGAPAFTGGRSEMHVHVHAPAIWTGTNPQLAKAVVGLLEDHVNNGGTAKIRKGLV